MDGKWEEIAVFGDTHGKTVEMKVLNHINKHYPSVDVYVHNGDILDCSEANPFPGAYRSVSMVEEHNWSVEFLNDWFTTIDKLCLEHNGRPAKKKFNLGNHGNRPKRGSEYRTPPAFKLYTGWLDVLAVILAGFEMVEEKAPSGGKIWVPKGKYCWSDVYYEPGINAHATRIGANAIALHAAKAFKLSSTMARLWFFDNILTRVPWARVVVQAHTHRQADHRYGAYRYIESGCACGPKEYADRFSTSGWPPMALGYTILRRNTETNLVDINAIDNITLGTETLFDPTPCPGSEHSYESRCEPLTDPFPQIKR